MTTYFGPLDKQSCVYFLFLSMIFFAVLIFTIIGEIAFIVRRYKELNFTVFTSGILLLFNTFIAYFVNRLLYTMCSKSLA
jgi:nitrate reductase NapE component